MKKHIHPLQFGNLHLPTNIIYAPLAGCSDFAFRQMSALYHQGLKYCEMVKMDALIRHDPNTYALLAYEARMHPVGAQLCGSKPHLAGPSAKIIEELGFPIVDLNCGCPVDKVTKDGSGSGMLKNPRRIGDVIHEMVSAVKIPVTLKIRAGWDDHMINSAEITTIAEQAGAKAITVHGRTREQRYKGKANWDHIKACKDVAKDIKVIGNGDLFTAEDAHDMLTQTNCDGVLIARGTMGQPWIAEDIIRKDQGKLPLTFSGHAYRDLLLQHMQFILSYQTEKHALTDLRRVYSWYLKKGEGTRKLRDALNKTKSLTEIETIINSYDWEGASIC